MDYHEDMTIEEFQASVPLQTYEDIKPYVERLRNGEQNLLWPDRNPVVCQILRNNQSIKANSFR